MIKVSICIQAYEHKSFIAQALDSVLAQKTDFDYEIILGEDESQDGTREICIEYARQYPDCIRLFLRSRKNVIYINGRPTGRFNFVENLKAARGKYFALLDGDDYWTDPHKLQKQVDFLESHPEYPLCFHSAFWLEEETGEQHLTYFGAPGVKEYYTLDDLLRFSNFIPTASTVFRNFIIQEYPDWYYKCPFGDFPLHIFNLYLSQSEKVGFIDEAMAMYRVHNGGVYSSASKRENLERLLSTYRLVGANLHLSDRVSYRLGISRWQVDLCEVYEAEGKRFKAILAACRALRVAPRRYKKRIARRALIALGPASNRLLDWWTLCRRKVLRLSNALMNQQAPQN